MTQSSCKNKKKPILVNKISTRTGHTFNFKYYLSDGNHRYIACKSIYGLKIDIEGHEDKALVPFLLNAKNSLLPKKIVIEKLTANSDYPRCTEAFAKLGYKLVARSKNNSFYMK